jgi:hypothetical protein
VRKPKLQLARRNLKLTKKRHTFCIARITSIAAIMLVRFAMAAIDGKDKSAAFKALRSENARFIDRRR